MNKKLLVGAIVIPVLLGAWSCDDNAAVNADRDTMNQIQLDYQNNQPVSRAPFSQYRQTVNDVEAAQIHGMATTTFQFNAGVKDPIDSCPSIGFPVPSTAQVTNPLVKMQNSEAVIAQMESNGIFTGDSSGTYVVCVAPNGTKYIDYWEGYVKTKGGPAHWDGTKIVLDGEPTVLSKDVTK
jgi:hypothetical protein